MICKIIGPFLSGAAMMMPYQGIRGKEVLPSFEPGSPEKVYILIICKKILVEISCVLKHLTVHHKAASAQGKNLLDPAVLPVIKA